MHVYLHLFGLTIPSYGLLIASGVVIGNIIAFFVLKHEKLDFNDWMILEAYCILGGFLGAKLLYLLVSYKSIDWSRITDFQYFNALMLSGFVFYGGLIFGLIFVFLAGKITRSRQGYMFGNLYFLYHLCIVLEEWDALWQDAVMESHMMELERSFFRKVLMQFRA